MPKFTCPTCKTEHTIATVSVDGKFWCVVCQKWVPANA